MSPNGEEAEQRSPVGTGAQNFLICSQPPTPRQHHDHDDDEDWTTVCCFCQETMDPNNTWSCCRCLHKCHFTCRHICGEDIVCVHCKHSHFLPGQDFQPPLTDAALRYNIANGVTVAGSSKLKRIDQKQIEIMDQLASAEPVDQPTTGGSRAMAAAVLSSAGAHEQSDIRELAQDRSASVSKRSIEDLRPPPGLNIQESEAKARKTMMIHSVNLQQQVVMLQSVVQRFEVSVNCDVSQEWLQSIWQSIGEIANHLHEVARFAVQGFDHQWVQHQGLQTMVEQLSVDTKNCLTFATRVAHTEDGLAKHECNVAMLRQKAEMTQNRFEKVIRLLEGTEVPVKEVFAQVYAERERISELASRLEHLENDGAVASDNDMCLAMDARINEVVRAIWNNCDEVGARPPLADGTTLVEQFKRLVEDRRIEHQRLIADLEEKRHAMSIQIEKFGTKMADRHEELAGELRREFLKFRSEVQATVGGDDQKIRKFTEDYLKTTVGDKTKEVRIEMYSKAIRDVEEKQKMLQTEMMKLKGFDDGR
eukprot:6013633-Amphidinium_carterae.1